MKIQRHFETETAQRETAQIRRMIVDLDRTLRILVCDIATEEERAQVSDPSDICYPVLARVMAARRDNLKITIAALQERLLLIGARASEAITIAA
jgi:hypothetical protein